MGRGRGDEAGAARRTGRAVLRFALRAALIALPLLALRAMLRGREPPLSGLSDRQLADIGLGRLDVDRFHGRSASPELDLYQALRWHDWR